MTDTEPEVPASKMEDTKFYVAQEGLRGRDGGPYLDQAEREAGENLRAKVEGREPDLEKASAVAGTVLATEGQLTDNTNSNPSMSSPSIPGTLNEDLAFQELSVDTATGQEPQEPDATPKAVASKSTSSSTATKSTSSSTP